MTGFLKLAGASLAGAVLAVLLVPAGAKLGGVYSQVSQYFPQGLYAGTTNAFSCTGDGMAMALRVGVPLKDMEMMQFHPTTLSPSGVLITEGCRGEGAYLLNGDGERFLKRYAPNAMELASRDVISRAEQTEIDEGRGIDGNVLLDLRHLGAERILERLHGTRDLLNPVSRRALVALDAVQALAEHAGPALGRLRPGPVPPRRVVTRVLVVAAGQLGDPVALVVQMEAFDGLFHIVPSSAGRAPGRSQAGPPWAMCMRLDAACIAVPLGDRPGLPAFSRARLDEGHHLPRTRRISRP